ncbi:MAG: CapA family protein [Gudongella sp.]|nr:CapA family protein [Gudongella sp.]
MKRSLFFIVLVLTLIGLSFIIVDSYIAFAPSVVEAEVENEEPVLELEEVVIEPPKPTELEILAVGDIMFHIPQINGARLSDGRFDFNPSFKYIKPYIEVADIAIANLETVIGGNEKGFKGFPRFNSPVESLDALKTAGFDVLVTANNHALDGGKNGIINTINEIEKRDLNHIGTSKEDRKPFIIVEKEKVKIALLSYTYGLNGLDSLLNNEDKSRMINLIDIETIQKDIAMLNNEDVDFTIAYIHWGNEYNREPSDSQKKLASSLAGLGVDLILGSHPHVIQTSENIKSETGSSYVIYSMGNFISNQSYQTMGVSYAEDGVMLEIKIIKDNETGVTSLEKINYEPTWIYRELKNNKYTHYILPIEKALNGELDIELSQSVIERMKKSEMDTLNTINNR